MRKPGTRTPSHPREGGSVPDFKGAGQDARLHLVCRADRYGQEKTPDPFSSSSPGHRSCGLNPRRLYSQPGQKQSFEIAPLAVIGRLRCGLTSLRFCCKANVVTASVAREPDVYRDSSNRLLGRGNQSNPAYIQPSCVRVTPSFQIFVMWRIRSPSNSMTYT